MEISDNNLQSESSKAVEEFVAKVNGQMGRVWSEMSDNLAFSMGKFYIFDINYIQKIITQLDAAEETIYLFLKNDRIPGYIKSEIVNKIGKKWFLSASDGYYWRGN